MSLKPSPVTTTQVDVSVVIVNWNSSDYLRKCLQSILHHTHALRTEIIVIDSGSFDGCGRMLHENYPTVKFIQSESNIGFAGANNQAYEGTTGEYVLFLNPDTEVVGSAIETLHRAVSSAHDAGLVGARLLNADGSVQSSCIQSFPTLANQLFDCDILRRTWPKSPLWGNVALLEEFKDPVEVDAISGACVLVKRSVFEQIGRFDDRYFMYAEDIDLSYRAKKAGYRNYYVPTAAVVHFGGTSSSQASDGFAAVMRSEANWRFLRKTRGRLYAMLYRLSMLAAGSARGLVLATATLLLRSGCPTCRRSLAKWVGIVRWSIGRAEEVRRFYPRVGTSGSGLNIGTP